MEELVGRLSLGSRLPQYLMSVSILFCAWGGGNWKGGGGVGGVVFGDALDDCDVDWCCRACLVDLWVGHINQLLPLEVFEISDFVVNKYSGANEEFVVRRGVLAEIQRRSRPTNRSSKPPSTVSRVQNIFPASSTPTLSCTHTQWQTTHQRLPKHVPSTQPRAQHGSKRTAAANPKSFPASPRKPASPARETVAPPTSWTRRFLLPLNKKLVSSPASPRPFPRPPHNLPPHQTPARWA